MWRTTLAFSILALITCPTSAIADTHYVSHDGTNTYPYDSWATATDSILLAIDAAIEWDTVRLAAGVFTADTLGLKKGLSFIGAGRDSTRIVHNGNDPQCIYLIDSCLVQGIHLQGITDTISGNVTFRLNEGVYGRTDQSAVIRDCRLSDMRYCVSTLWTDLVNPEKRVVLLNNEFSNFVSAADYLFASCRIIGNTFIVDNSDIGNPIKLLEGNAEIRKNTIIRTVPFSHPSIELNRCDTIWIQNNICVSAPYAVSAIYVNVQDQGYPTKGSIENNLCVGGWYGIVSQGGDIAMRNNIVARTEKAAIFYDTIQTTPGNAGYNLFWQNTHQSADDMAFRPDPGNLFVNPMFVDAQDFRLQAVSPATDAGDPSVLDADGSRSDIGPFGGPWGETYVYQDLPPSPPESLFAVWQDSGAALTWAANSEADLDVYRLYRDTLPVLSPDPFALLSEVMADDSAYFDTTDLRGKTVYYRLSAVDGQSNESELGNEFVLSVSAVDDGDSPALPSSFILHPNYPNPFNASTRVRLDVPMAGRVNVAVYDVLGRRVATLHDGALLPGRHELDWKPENAGSGVYFIVAKFDATTRVQKALLLK